MTCKHWDFEAVTLRMQERMQGREVPCPWCRLAEAEALVRECKKEINGLDRALWAEFSHGEKYDPHPMSATIDAFLAADSASVEGDE